MCIQTTLPVPNGTNNVYVLRYGASNHDQCHIIHLVKTILRYQSFSYFIGMYITHEKSWKNARPRSDVMIRRGAKKHVNICVCPSILPAAPPFCWLLPSKFWLMEFCGTQFRNNFQFVCHCNSWVQEVLKNDTNHANFFHLWCEKWNLSNLCWY